MRRLLKKGSQMHPDPLPPKKQEKKQKRAYDQGVKAGCDVHSKKGNTTIKWRQREAGFKYSGLTSGRCVGRLQVNEMIG